MSDEVRESARARAQQREEEEESAHNTEEKEEQEDEVASATRASSMTPVRVPVGQNISASALQAHIVALNIRGNDGFTGYDEEFAHLEQKSDTNFFGDFQEALKHVNRPKNRYSNVLPLDKTRVVMATIPGEQGSDYINANYVAGVYPEQYIAAQGPLKETAGHFWRMIYEQRCNVVVMLTRVIENNKQKCVKYWPSQQAPKTFGEIQVTLKEKQKEHGLVIRYLELRCNNETRKITHFQYKEWPDHGLPQSAATFRHLLHLVDASHDATGPIVVHCSAGIGRTGTFCTVHTIIQGLEAHLRERPDEVPTFNIFATVLGLRGSRVGMVQTRDQYEFCYRAVMEEYEGAIKRSTSKRSRKKE